MPNINNKELSRSTSSCTRTATINGCFTDSSKTGFSGSGGSDKSGDSGGGSNFMQPQTDPYASIYAPSSQ